MGGILGLVDRYNGCRYLYLYTVVHESLFAHLSRPMPMKVSKLKNIYETKDNQYDSETNRDGAGNPG